MGKKAPRLTVVQGQARSETGGSNSLEILSVGELNEAKQKRVESVIGEFCPNAGVLGVAVTGRNWDLRPFVALSTEEGPSVIRFLGPEVSMCKSIQARTQDIFTRISKAASLNSALRDWGTFEEQLWYRRGLVDHTLGDLLAENDQISLSRAVELCQSVIGTVEAWHAEAIFHGHITVDNIVVEGSGTVGLVDAGVGLALVQSSNSFGFVDFPAGYQKESFAPETLAGETLISGSDVFGVARVIQTITAKVDEHKLSGTERAMLRSLMQAAQEAVHPDPTKRPSLSVLAAELRDRSSHGGDKPHQTIRERVAAKAPVRGKTIQPRKKGQRNRSAGDSGTQPAVSEPVQPEPPQPQPPAQPQPPIQQQPEPPAQPQPPAQQQPEPPIFNEPEPYREPEPFTPQDPVFDAAQPEVEDSVFSSGSFAAPEPGPFAEPAPQAAPMGYSPAPQEPAAQPAPLPEFDTTPELKDKPEESWTPVFLFMASVLVIVVFVFDLSPITGLFSGEEDVPQYSVEELKSAWRSEEPEYLAEVVRSAIHPKAPDAAAQRLIVRSIRAGDETLPGMNMPLLSVAFHDSWYQDLSTADRHAALVFGLTDYLRKADIDIPDALVALDELHPGVILAVTANAVSPGARKALKGIPLKRLASLAVPFGPAFKELEKGLDNPDCSSPFVHMLAKFMTVAPESIRALEVKQFVEIRTEAKLRSLAHAFSEDTKGARKVLNDLVNHANIQVPHPYLEWGRQWNLINWNELIDNDKLFVLAGLTPSQAVSPGNLGRMFRHPAPIIRSYAVEKAIDAISFRHPAAVPVLLVLKDNPTLLNAEQTMHLALLLESPGKAKESVVRKWLDSKPSDKILKMLLLETVKYGNRETALLDFEISRYLQHNKYRFDIPELRKLVVHPDAFTRSYAYFETAKLRDRKTARQILEIALDRETDINFREQLQSNIDALRAAEDLLAQ